MKVVLTGGGTGGHIYPAVAIGHDLQAKVPGLEILYIGTADGMEGEIVPKEGFAFSAVEVESLPRSLSLKTVRTGAKLLKGTLEAIGHLRKFKPDVVVGTGGYVCGPVVLAARLLKVPSVIHEQNALPGITNKLLARFAKAVLLTFPESKPYFPPKAVLEVTGLPIRPGLLEITRADGAKAFGLKSDKFTVLVTGGSRGARSINLSMLEILQSLVKTDNIQVIMATGTATYEEFMARSKELGIDYQNSKHIVVRPYLNNMGEALAASDICIGRAGAAFVAEVLALGKPTVLIPYPFAAENHQEFNARAVAEKGAAVMILDKELTAARLNEEILSLKSNREKLKIMSGKAKQLGKPEALDNISARILNIVSRQS